jgi:hypothetical protein
MRRVVGAVLPAVATAGIGNTPVRAVVDAGATFPFMVELTPAMRYASPGRGGRVRRSVPLDGAGQMQPLITLPRLRAVG